MHVNHAQSLQHGECFNQTLWLTGTLCGSSAGKPAPRAATIAEVKAAARAATGSTTIGVPRAPARAAARALPTAVTQGVSKPSHSGKQLFSCIEPLVLYMFFVMLSCVVTLHCRSDIEAFTGGKCLLQCVLQEGLCGCQSETYRPVYQWTVMRAPLHMLVNACTIPHICECMHHPTCLSMHAPFHMLVNACRPPSLLWHFC